MKEKIKELISPNPDQKYQKFVENFRKKHIPAQYNQIKMAEELNNPDIDHFLSISNRTDGKSINYVHFLLKVAVDYDIGLSFFSRNMMLRTSYQELINDIIDISTIFDRRDFNFIRSQYYVSLNYKDKTIALISDLNNASELKYFSNYLKNFPIMIYDEFLALEDEYLPDEWVRLKTIYESIDRKENYPLIHKPKIFYFGNAVNFDSPVLHGLKIFNILENHPINEARMYKRDKMPFMLEIHRNENANERRNTRAFDSDNDSMTTAQFETNPYNIATENDRNHVRNNPRFIYIKLKESYMRIWFNRDSLVTILSIESRIDEPYTYNMQLKDNKEHSTYLNEKYFDEDHVKRIDKGAYLFDNNFSKNYITTDFSGLNELKINKIIREFLRDDDDERKEMESKEKQFQENYIEQTKRGLMQKLWG
jgi:hypothetical protein